MLARAVNDTAPDLFITDLRLRGVENGAQLVARLSERFAHFPSLVITGETAADSIDVGSDGKIVGLF